MPQDQTITGAGYKLIIATGSVTKKVQEAIMVGLKRSGEIYKAAVIENISLDDHSLAELRRLGHPYAISSPGPPVHSDDRMVHIQTGRLKASIKLQGPKKITERTFGVFISSDDPAFQYLIHGTSRMRPRRFHEKALEDVKDQIYKPLIEELKRVKHRIAAAP